MPIRYDESLPDPEAYLALFETTGWNEMYRLGRDELAAALQQSWSTVSAYDGELLVGFGRLMSDGVIYAMIFDMIVAPPHQRQGIGSEILRRLVGRCDAAGIRDILLFSARGKAGFYEKHGFVRRPENAPGMILRRV